MPTKHSSDLSVVINTIVITSLGLCVFGQNFNRPKITGSVSEGSFSKNCTIQYASYNYNSRNKVYYSPNSQGPLT